METNKQKIAELQAQRIEINRRIRELKRAGEISVGNVRIAKLQYPSVYNQDRWALSYKVPGPHGRSSQYKALFIGDSRKECIDAIQTIIDELSEMAKAIAKEEQAPMGLIDVDALKDECKMKGVRE